MADWQARSIFHFIWPCTNVERTMAFFAHFGFEVIKDNRNVKWPEYVGSNFDMMPGSQGRAVQLVLPHDDRYQTRIDLIEWVRPRWTNVEIAGPPETRIPRVLALLTRNVHAAYHDLVARGLEATAPVRAPDPVIGVQGVVCFRDPDGNIVELIEYFGDQLGSRTDGLPSTS